MKVEPAKAETVSEGNEQVNKEDDRAAFAHLRQAERRYGIIRDHADESARGGTVRHGEDAQCQPDAEYEETDCDCENLGFVAWDLAFAQDVPSQVRKDASPDSDAQYGLLELWSAQNGQ